MKNIDGKAIAQAIREEVKNDLRDALSLPGLGVLLVGNDEASSIYVKLKEKAAEDAGIRTDVRRVSEEISDDELVEIIRGWNADPSMHGILVQVPLPPGHDTDRLIAEIDPKKDVDGFHPENVEASKRGEGKIIPPVHEAVLRLIASTGIDPRNASATILANSDVFAEPLARLLQRAGFLTAIMSPDSLAGDILRSSEVIVTAVGRPGFLGADLISPGAVIIDIGTTRGDDGKVHGDVDAASLANMDVWLTPVPGGVGPMTVALLLKNVVRAMGGRM